MLSILKSIWIVLRHTFRRKVTIRLPGGTPIPLPPRFRGRIILSRDPDGQERCVACYLCAAACPVDCIALQATEDEHGRRYPAFFRINFSRCILCGFCEEACPTDAIQLTPDFEYVEYERPNLVYEKEDLLISGMRQISGLQLLPGGRTGHRRQGQGRGPGRNSAPGCPFPAAVTRAAMQSPAGAGEPTPNEVQEPWKLYSTRSPRWPSSPP